jgi:hypothetical protein
MCVFVYTLCPLVKEACEREVTRQANSKAASPVERRLYTVPRTLPRTVPITFSPTLRELA